VRVVGTCKNGHATATRSEPGRVTWTGECATDGCAERVHCKRAPKDKAPAPADAATPPPADEDGDPYAVRKVTDYGRHERRGSAGRAERRSAEPAQDPGSGAGVPAAEPAGDAGQPKPAEPAGGGGRAEPAPPAAADDGSVSEDEPSEYGASPEPDDLTSSRTSSADPGAPLKPLGKAALKATTAQAILIGSAMAHRVAVRSEGQRLVGLYVADEDDADNIAGPLASIMQRHGGVGGAMNPDTNDALQAVMGLAGYVSKQVVKASQAREVDQHLAAGGTLDNLAGDPS
jgi:hypothetical protein